jgi:hypothetical protein
VSLDTLESSRDSKSWEKGKEKRVEQKGEDGEGMEILYEDSSDIIDLEDGAEAI